MSTSQALMGFMQGYMQKDAATSDAAIKAMTEVAPVVKTTFKEGWKGLKEFLKAVRDNHWVMGGLGVGAGAAAGGVVGAGASALMSGSNKEASAATTAAEALTTGGHAKAATKGAWNWLKNSPYANMGISAGVGGAVGLPAGVAAHQLMKSKPQSSSFAPASYFSAPEEGGEEEGASSGLMGLWKKMSPTEKALLFGVLGLGAGAAVTAAVSN
jgi:hypothetical protein